MKKENYNNISIEHFAQQINLNVITDTAGFIISKNPTTLEEHSLNFDYPHIIEGIAFVFCIEGKARVRINLTEHEIEKNTILVAVPNNIIHILEQSTDLRIDFLFFTFDFISNIRLAGQLGNIKKTLEEQVSLKLENDVFQELLTVHRLMVRQYQKPVAYREDIIKNLLYAIIYEIIQIYDIASVNKKNEPANRKHDLHMKFIALLFDNYKSERSIQFYANRLHITPKHFSKIINEVSGKPVLDWVDEMVIMAAKSLLKSTDMTVSQIADELNFANASFFGTYFKKRTGMTPIAYRVY